MSHQVKNITKETEIIKRVYRNFSQNKKFT